MTLHLFSIVLNTQFFVIGKTASVPLKYIYLLMENLWVRLGQSSALGYCLNLMSIQN